jgi:hypothetical protein
MSGSLSGRLAAGSLPGGLAGTRAYWGEPLPVARGASAALWRAPREGQEKRPFDNHLEGFSIKRYSAVAEAMSNRRYHPIEETGDATIWRD